MYIERPDNTRNVPYISVVAVILTVVQFCVLFFVRYVSMQDTTSGYVVNVFHSLIYLSTFVLVVGVLMGVKNRSAGLLDMPVVFVTLLITYFLYQ